MSRALAENDMPFDTAREAAGRAADMARNGTADALGDSSRKAETAKDGAADAPQDLSARLKAVGIDTDVMVAAARDRASGLGQIVSDEMQGHPLRTLGLAAAAGLVLGFLSSR